MKKIIIALAAAILLPAMANAQTVSQFPWTWDFADSASTFTTWQTPAGATEWDHLGTFGNYADGCIYAYSDEQMIVSPAFQIPANAQNLNLSFYIYGEGQYVSYIGYPAVQVLVSTNGTDVADFTDTIYTGTSTSYFERHQVALDSYANQTIHIAFIVDGFYAYLVLDDVKLGAPTVPEYYIYGNIYAQQGVDYTYEAIYVDGDTTVDNTFTWSSVLGQVTENNEKATINYSASGLDTITLIVSNTHGADTAYYYVQVLDCSGIDQFPYTESFEDLTTAYCWSFINASTTATTDWDIYTSQQYAYDGQRFLYSSFDTTANSDCYAISPAINMPNDATGYILSYYIIGRTASDEDHAAYEVLISTTDATPSSFTHVLADTADGTNYEQRTIELDAYAGETIYIAFRNASQKDFSDMFIDKIEIRCALAPVFTISVNGNTITNNTNNLVATYVEGVQTGMTYAWTSLMASAGQATLTNANTPNATIVYTAAGIDTITFTAQNGSGTYRDTAVVEVISCDAITTFPWNEGFEGATACWTTYSNTTDQYDDVSIETYADYAYEGTNYIWFGYNDYSAVDQWAISPEITLPAGSNYELSWQALTNEYQGVQSHYEVLVSTNGTAEANFSNQIFDETGASDEYEYHSASLAQYAGQTIRIAFHNITAMGGDAMLIDAIAIAEPTVPTVSINGPTYALAGNEVTYTATSANASTFSWTVDGTAVAGTGNTLSHTFDAAGTYTITVTATNAAGSANASMTTTVGTCDDAVALPWSESFENGEGCWTFINNDGAESGFAIYANNAQYQYAQDGQYCLAGPYSDDFDVDQWAISPAISIAENATNVKLNWYVIASIWDGIMTNYEVLVSNGGKNPADFTTTIHTENDTTADNWYEERSANITGFAGQTIRIAFHNKTAAGGDAMFIDNITLTANSNGINDVDNIAISVYPNPAYDVLNVNAENVRKVEVIDVNGRVVIESANAGAIAISDLSEGVYMVRVITDAGVRAEKIVKR